MQKRRIIPALLIPPILLLFSGCTKTAWIHPEKLQPEQKIRGVVTADGQQVAFNAKEARLRGDTIYAQAHEDGLRFALEDLQSVGIRRDNTLATLALFAGALLVLYTIFESATHQKSLD